MENLGFRALIIGDGDSVVVQGLELDIATQGDTEEIAMERFDALVRAELIFCAKRSLDPNEVIGQAPASFFETWEKCASDDSLSNDFEFRRCA